MILGILVTVLLTVITVCVLSGKTLNVNITHTYNTPQNTNEVPAQLTDDEIKKQTGSATVGLAEAINSFIEGD